MTNNLELKKLHNERLDWEQSERLPKAIKKSNWRCSSRIPHYTHLKQQAPQELGKTDILGKNVHNGQNQCQTVATRYIW